MSAAEWDAPWAPRSPGASAAGSGAGSGSAWDLRLD